MNDRQGAAGASEMAEFLAIKPGNGTDTLVPYSEAYVAFVRTNPALYRLMFGEGLTAVSQSNQAVHEFRARVYDIMKSNLACSGVDWRANNIDARSRFSADNQKPSSSQTHQEDPSRQIPDRHDRAGRQG